MLVLTLQYTQRPPDDFIDIIGRVLDANISFSKRKEERISLSKEAMRKLQILAGESAVFIGGVPRRCILRDVSFSGAKFIMVGVAKFLLNKEASLRIDFQDPRESFLIQGTFVRTEMIEGRTDLIAVGMKFNEELIPMGYKMRINDYLSSKPIERVAPAPAAAPAAKPAAPAAPEEKTDAK
ncbi:MAG: PilZ domain-containing protein [Spirochaetaceae bacterium]|nr:PilZ domain-containing protein [Spirochaetaceae bacterium]